MQDKSIARLITSFKKKEIANLFKSSKIAYKSPAIEIRRANRTKTNFSRILPIVQKSFGNSPERNYFKRIIRSIFYQNRIFESSFDFIIMAKSPVSKISYDYVKQILIQSSSK